MDDNQFNKRSTSVDQLNDELYYQKGDFEARPRRTIHDKQVRLETDFNDGDFNEWKDSQKKLSLPTSFFKKVFLGVLGFFVLTVIVAALSFYTGKQTVSSDLISLEIVSQPFVDGGETLEVQVRIQNFNVEALELPDLVLSYPKDSREGGEKEIMRRSLENINQGDRASEEFNLTLFGQEGEVRNIEATLEYRIDGSNAIFVKEASHDVIIRSTPSVISVTAPDEIVRGQLFTMEVGVASNSNTVINNMLLDVEYPDGFELVSADPEPDILNHLWSFPVIGDEKQTITITGRLSGLEGQSQSFFVNFGKQNLEKKSSMETLFNRSVHTVDIMKPFVQTLLVLNGSEETVIPIRGGSEVDGEIEITNTLDEALSDVTIELVLGGDLYNPVGLRTQDGFFNSNILTITWDKTTLSSLALLEPGVTRTLSFTLPTQELIARGGALENPELTLSVNIAGVETNGIRREASDVSKARVIANSDIELTGTVLHADGPFENYGPMPPTVNQATSYTVTLNVTNSSNEISNASVEFFLPSYVDWTGSVAPSAERSSIQYNESTREVIWNLGILRAGLGINGSAPRTLSFQVEVTPSLAQVGDQVKLTNDIVLSGEDAWTGSTLSFKKTALENMINNSSEAGADGRIQE